MTITGEAAAASEPPFRSQWLHVIQGDNVTERRSSLLLGLRMLIAEALNHKLDPMFEDGAVEHSLRVL